MPLSVSQRYKLLRKIEPYLFLAPALVVIGLIFAFPIVRLVTLSFQRPFQGQMLFVGLTNYQTIFQDEVFLRAVRNNLTLLISVPIMVVIALILAIFLFDRIRGWQLYRTTLFLPYLLPITVVGLIFSYIFQLSGVLNDFLKVIGLEQFVFDWLGSTRLALPTLMFVIIWKEVGFGIVLFLARLMSVEEELFDAAKIDGADWWKLHWYITIPQLATTIEFFTVVSIITILSWVFGYVYVMTGGGPGNATMVTELFIYLAGFRYNQMNIAAAVSVILLLVTGIFIFLELRLRERSAALEEVP
ncbi:MAG: sugar ABC transporter permease [Anaerolineales bacterium]|nr:sugar ABC transporter permease [Anaerolineales bacterium]MDW8162644.1 sugar ABC transporter permease [Anaerolineales bacterium]